MRILGEDPRALDGPPWRGDEERGIYTRLLTSVRNILYLRAMLRAYKYALFPDEEQSTQLAKTFGCVRFVFNAGLETKNTAYRMRAAAARA